VVPMTTPFLFLRGNFVCEDCIIVFERAVIRLAISESLKGLLLCGAPETIVLCKGFLAAECMT